MKNKTILLIEDNPDDETLTLRGGAEFQALGTTTKAFNHGDPTQLVAVVGVRLAR